VIRPVFQSLDAERVRDGGPYLHFQLIAPSRRAIVPVKAFQRRCRRLVHGIGLHLNRVPNTARINVGYDAVLHDFAFCSPIISRGVMGRKDEVYLGAGSAKVFGSETNSSAVLYHCLEMNRLRLRLEVPRSQVNCSWHLATPLGEAP
jgi:hypothetical protein